MMFHRLPLCTILLAILPLIVNAGSKDKNSLGEAAPFTFVNNIGQIKDQYGQVRADIDYRLGVEGMNLFVGENQVHYQWVKTPEAVQVEKQPFGSMANKPSQQSTLETYRLDVSLVGANKKAKAEELDTAPYYEMYYLDNIQGVARSHKRIVYKNVYPFIDWILYVKDGHLKYDFIVHPGGNPAQIKLRYSGATKMAIEKGMLFAYTPYGVVTEQKPFSYDAATSIEVPSMFRLSESDVSFEVKSTIAQTLVIDPTLDWSSYYGGSSLDYFWGITTNQIGDVYAGGYTISPSNIVTSGSHQTTLTGGFAEAFAVKFNTNGVRQWATYFGGNGWDLFSGATCTASGDIYFSGISNSSSGVATTGAHQTIAGGGGAWDAILVKFNSVGTLQWATYYGGNQVEDFIQIDSDPQGNVYIGGTTGSSSGIATMGTYRPSIPTGNIPPISFLAKFDPSGVRQWGTYFAFGEGYGVAADNSGNSYLTASTAEPSLATIGSHQVTLAANPPFGTNPQDGILGKFNSSGSLIWATYYGGSDIEYLFDVECDNKKNVYIAGRTASKSQIASAGTFQSTLTSNPGFIGFVAKFDSAGVRKWSTYYGENTSASALGTQVTAIAVNDENKVYFSGHALDSISTKLATSMAHKTSPTGEDAFIAEFDNNGNRTWGTYFGANGIDITTQGSISLSPLGKLLVAGQTNAIAGVSSPNISTAGAHQTTYGGGNYDGIISSWIVDTLVYIEQPYYDTLFCAGDSFDLAYTVTHPFKAGNIFTAQLSNASGSFAFPTNVGLVSSTTAGSIRVGIPSNANGSSYRIRILASNPAKTSADNGVNIRVKPRPNLNATANAPVCAGDTLRLYAYSSSSGTILYDWTGPNSFIATGSQFPWIWPVTLADAGHFVATATLNGCSATDTVLVTVKPLPATPVASSNTPVCPNNPLTLNASSTTAGVSYTWTGPNSFASALQNPVVSANATISMGGAYSVTASLAGCTSPSSTTNVLVAVTTPTPTATSNSVVCRGGVLNLFATSVAGATYQWSGPGGFSSTAQNPTISNAQAYNAGTYSVTATVSNCTSIPASTIVAINTNTAMGAYVSPNDTICPGTMVTFVGFPQNGGTSPTYNWVKNGVSVSTNLVYSTNMIADGDYFWCSMTATGVCSTSVTVTSDTIRMSVQPVVNVPKVYISASPGLAVSPLQMVAFTANVLYGGTAPTYQWYKNGIALPGAQYSTLTTNGLLLGDKISVNIVSNDPCAYPTSAADTVTIAFPSSLAINKTSFLTLFPNPNKGSFTIAGITANEVYLNIINALGQTVYSKTQRDVPGAMQVQATLPPGAYMVRVVADGKVQVLRFNAAL